MQISIEEIQKHYDPDALYDLSSIVESYRNTGKHNHASDKSMLSVAPYEWQTFYSMLFPEKQYAGLWIGHAYSTKFIQIPLSRINKDDEGYAYCIYGHLYLPVFQNGKRVEGYRYKYRGGPEAIRILHKVTQGEWIRVVYDPDNEPFVHVPELIYKPASFAELNLIEPRPFAKAEAELLHRYSDKIQEEEVNTKNG